jgi:electron transfer flavoprotein beta subunit
MKILVCISVVPDTTSKISIDSSKGFIDTQGLTFIVGPYDDYALSRAIELKESNGAEVVVLHMGPAESEILIRKCLALGADSAVRIDGIAKDSYQLAKEMASYVQLNPFDLILMGKEAIDYNSGQTHGILAGLLQMTHFSPVMQLNVNGSKLKLEVEIDGGKAEVSCDLPAVLGCQEPIAEWKIPSMRGIMAARTKEIKIITPSIPTSQICISEEINETNRKQIMIPSDQLHVLVDYLKQDIQL